MKLDIPENHYIRWQAALAVVEDLQEDKTAPFDMGRYNDARTLWEKTNGCGTAACFAGYIAVSPYCEALGAPRMGPKVRYWLTSEYGDAWVLHNEIFDSEIDEGSRAKTLAYLTRRLKRIFKDATGEKLVAPLTFYI